MYTLSWHQEGQKNVRQAHNRRDAHAIGRDSNVDTGRSKDNITLIDMDVRNAYHRLFDASVREYNGRARASRQISDYYTHISKSGKQTAYEAIVQIGSAAESSPDRAVAAFKQYVADWRHRNPNMVLIGAYIHMDESTPHMHLDYIPVARCNRGMRVQNSLTRALDAQGYKTCNRDGRMVTAQVQWEQSERDAMRDICRDMGIELYQQGIGRKRHLSVKEYKDCQEQLQTARTELTSIETGIAVADIERQQLLADNRQLESRRERLSGDVSDLSQEIDSKIDVLRAQNRVLETQASERIIARLVDMGYADTMLDDLMRDPEWQELIDGMYNQLMYDTAQWIDIDDDEPER